MTRINLVLPHQLTNKHLMAEYRELPRIFTAVRKLEAQGKTPKDVDIPERYVLGKGHAKFFYNKIGWLAQRHASIYRELVEQRGFILDPTLFAYIHRSARSIRTQWFGPYEPTPEEIYLNMARLCIRSGLDTVTDELSG